MTATEHNKMEAYSMLSKLEPFFMRVIELRDKNREDRDVLFLFELLYVLEEFSKIASSTQGDKFPHVSYIEEKLSRAKRVMDNCYSYFLQRKEQEKNTYLATGKVE